MFLLPIGGLHLDASSGFLQTTSYGISCILIIVLGDHMRCANCKFHALTDALKESAQKLDRTASML